MYMKCPELANLLRQETAVRLGLESAGYGKVWVQNVLGGDKNILNLGFGNGVVRVSICEYVQNH